MILGIGIDLCAVARMEKSLQKPAFAARVFAPQEQEFWQDFSAKHRAESAAAAFAAKEAFLKAAGTGLGGFALAELAVLHKPSGAPYFCFLGDAARFIEQNHLTAHLSLTHDGELAAAYVILEQNFAGTCD